MKIFGKLLIDSPFSISGSQLKMMTGSSIEIETSSSEAVSIANNKIFSDCSTTWSGFTINQSTSGIIGISFNQMEDASPFLFDIKSPNAKINFFINTFNRNLNVIRATNITLNALFTANTFNCSSPINGTSSYAINGIDLLNVTASIGAINPSFNFPNKFYNHDRGISSVSSAIKIGRSEFSRNSTGVYANVGSVKITGQSDAKRNLFSYNKNDIASNSASLDVTLAQFDYCTSTNLSSTGNTTGDQVINIANNVFNVANDNHFSLNSHRTAIILDRTSGTNSTGLDPRNSINDNIVDIADFGSTTRTGIKIKGYAGTNDNMSIRGNQIRVGAGGVHASTSAFLEVDLGPTERYEIIGNTLRSYNQGNSANNYTGRWGFFIHDGTSSHYGISFYENKVLGNEEDPEYDDVGSNPIDGGMCAFHFQNSNAIDFCKNTTDNTLRGFHMMGDCGATAFYRNNILNHALALSSTNSNISTGLLIQDYTSTSLGFLGGQNCAHNKFYLANYSPGVGAKFDNSPSPERIVNNRFIVENGVTIELPTPRTPTGNGTPENPFWFKPDFCPISGDGCDLTKMRDSVKIDETEGFLAGNNTTYTNAINAEDWEQKKQLMSKLLDYPSLIATTNLSSFYNAHYNSSPGKFARFDKSFKNAVLLSAAQQDHVDSLVHRINVLMVKIDSLDGSLRDSLEILNAGTSFFNYRESFLQEGYNLNNQLTTARDVILSLQSSRLLICQQFNDSLPSDELFEANQKSLNFLQIKFAKGIPFSSTDSINIRTIANQCPQLAGRTRDRAVNWLPVPEASSYRSENVYDPPCDRQTKMVINEPMVGITITPNPASNEINVELNYPEIGTLNIFDIAGTEKISIPVSKENGSISIQTAQLLPGMYFVQFKGNNSIAQKSFIIIR